MKQEKQNNRRKIKIPWYLSAWFILLISIISLNSKPLIIIPIILTFFHILKYQKIKKELAVVESFRAKGYSEALDLEKMISEQKEELSKIEKTIQEKNQIIDQQNNKIEKLKKDYIETEDLVLMQDFGFFNPKYNLESSIAYKQRLDSMRERQKAMVRSKEAVYFSTNWTVNGSKAQGRKMVNDAINLAIRSFNNECDATISKVTVANIDSSEKRINKSYETINRLNKINGVSIKREYLNLKIEELYLALEYAQKVEEEKEEQRRIREQMREEAKVRKEIEKMKQQIEKEETHFLNAIESLIKQKETASEELLKEIEAKIKELEEKLNEIKKQKEDLLYREQNTRAGYVYIISNIGSFGENVYKIGVTRRLEPMDRVRELGDASVPFKFDVHAMIFSDDAPTLENVLHKTFDSKRVNLINSRKEFFEITLDEIKEVVEKHHDKTVEFVYTAAAEEYRESQAIKNKQLAPI